MVKATLKERLCSIINRLENGCGQQGCRIKQSIGQATNGPCRCGPVTLSAELHLLADEVLETGLEYSK